jgi:hypothetical protein
MECDVIPLLVAVILGAAIAGSPVAMKVVRSRFKESENDSSSE